MVNVIRTLLEVTRETLERLEREEQPASTDEVFSELESFCKPRGWRAFGNEPAAWARGFIKALDTQRNADPHSFSFVYPWFKTYSQQQKPNVDWDLMEALRQWYIEVGQPNMGKFESEKLYRECERVFGGKALVMSLDDMGK